MHILSFGTALNAESTTSLSKRFTSYERSGQTGLDYAINRTYDSKLGRFTQVDPIGMSAVSLAAPQTLNLYAYCGNDPINHTDPFGLFFGKLFKAIGKIFKAINKILKWVVIAIAVILVVAAIVYFTGGTMSAVVGDFLGKLIGLAAKFAKFLESGKLLADAIGIGFNVAAGLYSVGAIASRWDDDTPRQEEIDRIANDALLNIYRVLKNLPYLLDIIKDNNKSIYTKEVVICHAAVESSLNPDAEGFDGEIGLFQVKPSTAKPLAPLFNGNKKLNTNQVRKKLYDPKFNTQVGTTYLNNLGTKFGNLRDALGAYKQGVTSVSKDGLTRASKEYVEGIFKCSDELEKRR